MDSDFAMLVYVVVVIGSIGVLAVPEDIISVADGMKVYAAGVLVGLGLLLVIEWTSPVCDHSQNLTPLNAGSSFYE